jgi:hypothetical protein
LRISLPFDLTEVSKRFRVVEELCVAWIMVDNRSTMLRRTTAI